MTKEIGKMVGIDCGFGGVHSLLRQIMGVLLALATVGAGSALSQQLPVIYPSKGQSAQQQANDEAGCRGWAEQQTGFNPAYAPATSGGGGSSGGEVVRGAAGGALLGTVGGAIGGNVGKGAVTQLRADANAYF